MSRASKLLKNIDEAFDVKGAVNDLIGVDFSKSKESKGKAAELIRGLFFSDDPLAEKVIGELDKWFSDLKI